jgi:hypothetical protein
MSKSKKKSRPAKSRKAGKKSVSVKNLAKKGNSTRARMALGLRRVR